MAHKPPRHLSKDAGRRWRELVSAYDLQDERSLHLLTLAFEQFDRMREASASIAADGAIVLDRYSNPKANPAIAIENRAQRAHIAALKEALRGRKRVDHVAEKSRSASVVALHEFLDNRRVK